MIGKYDGPNVQNRKGFLLYIYHLTEEIVFIWSWSEMGKSYIVQ